MNVKEKLQLQGGTKKANTRNFRSLVGGLIYLAHTWPYISFVVGVVSRFVNSPTKHLFGAAKRSCIKLLEHYNMEFWHSSFRNKVIWFYR